jgi:plasmid stability protein
MGAVADTAVKSGLTVDCKTQSHYSGVMRVLTIRNLPDETYRTIAQRARRNRRSLQQEALMLLERVRALEKDDSLKRAEAIRERLRGRSLGDTVREIREERKR